MELSKILNTKNGDESIKQSSEKATAKEYVYFSAAKWAKFLEMPESKVKGEDIIEKLYSDAKKMNSGKSLKENMDILLEKEKEVYTPQGIKPLEIEKKEIEGYFFGKELETYLELLDTKFSNMQTAFNQKDYHPNKLHEFDSALGLIPQLVMDFKPSKFSLELDARVFEEAASFGTNSLMEMSQWDGMRLSTNYNQNLFDYVKQLLIKYAANGGVLDRAAKNLAQIESIKNQKIGKFKGAAKEHQNLLYNAALEETQNITLSNMGNLPLREKYIEFSKSYSKILGLTDETFGSSMVDLDRPLAIVYNDFVNRCNAEKFNEGEK
jgi:hypothetical protein